jgi:DNA-binding NarL/FixJ family response regulator
MADSLQILIADDHALFRKGFAMLLQDSLAQSKVIEASGFDSALDILAGNAGINAAFFDLMMPGMAGAESIRAVREAYPALRVGVVTGLENRALALQVIDAGANGYILKSASEEEMIRAVNRLLTGETYLPNVLPQIPDAKSAWTMPHIGLKAEKIADLPLTQRQRDVMAELAAGLSNKEIARRLGLAEGTVKVHLAAIFRVLSARNRTEAVLKASKLVSSEP